MVRREWREQRITDMYPNVVPVTDEMQDLQIRNFLSGLDISVTSASPSATSYSRYYGTYEGWEIQVRVASKPMLLGNRLLYLEMIYEGSVFQIIGMDTMNQIAPNEEHLTNLQVGLARLVYKK